MSEFVWVTREYAEAIHDRQLAEHGGGTGIRDVGLLESALGRPQNRFHYSEPDLAELAAAYAFGIARNHPFVDGNKRTAWVAARLFLRLNDVVATFDKAEATVMMQQLAAGELTEDQVAAWFRDRIS
jgi:death-on-curing protein